MRKMATEQYYQLAETRHGHILSTSNSQHGPRKYVTYLRRTRNRRGSASRRRKVYLCRRENHLLISDVETAGTPPHPPTSSIHHERTA